MSEKIPLAQALSAINAEIHQAHNQATLPGHEPVMQFAGCEFEFAIDVEAKAGGGFHIWLLKLSGEAKRTESNTVKIKYNALEGFVASAEGKPNTMGERYERTGEPPAGTGETPQ